MQKIPWTASTYAPSTHRDEHSKACQQTHPSTNPTRLDANLPEVPSSNDRLSTVVATEYFIVQSLRAIVVAQVERRVRDLVQDHELETNAAVAARAHGFQLE